MAEMVGEASIVILWVCHWYIKIDSILVFSDSGELGSSHCMVPLNWEHPGKGFTCPGHPLLLEKYLFFVFVVIKPGSGKKAVIVLIHDQK